MDTTTTSLVRACKIRGPLCVKCNVMIGMAKDGPELLKRGIQYLKENG